MINQVRRFAEQLRQQHIPLRQVILFGSFAKNEQHEWSDIDVALVADGFTGASFIDIKPFVRTLVEHVDIEPHTFSPEQFTDWNPFVQEIKRTGIVIGEWEPTAAKNRAGHLP
ncbi:nucleotidyltransferase family protein [Hymenobacter weizhouensis]|uniref:nucleotidyltransferase family protein n=1 Tax=Hymenobacter sp. YIM 151500-1 TaxID=2987689 RepID=UPI002227C115|nr:nucleotidyltransferase domain-containing protein [Hymenobacter sp. YIM 151500-1]UYZ62624.1 nucleotidyltransferase domain-containing protein [Hymenobacter sp. YIM 151500-1]